MPNELATYYSEGLQSLHASMQRHIWFAFYLRHTRIKQIKQRPDMRQCFINNRIDKKPIRDLFIRRKQAMSVKQICHLLELRQPLSPH